MGPIDCLAQAVYYEARGEVRSAQEAVAHVVKNRGANFCKVVYNGCQFSWVCRAHKAPFGQAWIQSRVVALESLTKPDNTGGATFFHSGRSPYWAKVKTLTVKYGGLKFYR